MGLRPDSSTPAAWIERLCALVDQQSKNFQLTKSCGSRLEADGSERGPIPVAPTYRSRTPLGRMARTVAEPRPQTAITTAAIENRDLTGVA